MTDKVESNVTGEWVKVQHTFTDYLAQYPCVVLYLSLKHGGSSVDELDGHLGVKMAASSIEIAKNDAVDGWLAENSLFLKTLDPEPRLEDAFDRNLVLTTIGES